MIKYLKDGNKYYCTNNEWGSIWSSAIAPNTGVEVNRSTLSKNEMTKQKIFKKYPLFYEAIISDFEYINKLLKEQYEKLNLTYPEQYHLNDEELNDDGYGHAYEVFALATELNKPYQQTIDENIIIGSDDGKVDGLVVDTSDANNDIFSFYQVKISNMKVQDFQVFLSNTYKIIRKQPIADASDLVYVIENLGINWHKTRDRKIILISDANIPGDQSIKFISNDSIFEKYIANRVTIRSNNYLSLVLKKDKREFAICNNDYFAFYSAKQLIEEIISLTQKQDSVFDSLFMDNVRRTVKKSADKFKKVLDNIDDKVNFHLYNNGISICGDVKCAETGTTVVNPMVINGQQTLRALYNLYLSNTGLIDDKVFVPLFIKNVKIDDLELRHNIAKYNNTQSKIADNDFMSIDPNARLIQSKILKNTDNLYLDIISNGTDSTKHLIERIYDNNVVSIADFIRLALTIENPLKMGTYKNKQNFAPETTAPVLKKYSSLDSDCKKICEKIIEYYKFISTNKDTKYLACNILIQYELFRNNKIVDIKKLVDDLDNYVVGNAIKKGDIIRCMKNNDFIKQKIDLDNLKLITKSPSNTTSN